MQSLHAGNLVETAKARRLRHHHHRRNQRADAADQRKPWCRSSGSPPSSTRTTRIEQHPEPRRRWKRASGDRRGVVEDVRLEMGIGRYRTRASRCARSWILESTPRCSRIECGAVPKPGRSPTVQERHRIALKSFVSGTKKLFVFVTTPLVEFHPATDEHTTLIRGTTSRGVKSASGGPTGKVCATRIVTHYSGIGARWISSAGRRCPGAASRSWPSSPRPREDLPDRPRTESRGRGGHTADTCTGCHGIRRRSIERKDAPRRGKALISTAHTTSRPSVRGRSRHPASP